MPSVTVKIPAGAHAKLAKLAAEQNRSMGDLLTHLIERERRRRLFAEADAAYARLRADPAAWADYQAELRSMEGTLMDGLADDLWVE